MQGRPLAAPDDERWAELTRRYGEETAGLLRRTERIIAQTRDLIKDTRRILDESAKSWPGLPLPSRERKGPGSSPT